MTTTEITKPGAPGPLAVMKHYLSDDSIKKRFEEMLGSRAGAFTNSIINVVGGNPQLLAVARTNPASVCRAAMRAATVNLAIDPSLGHSAIVPYKNEAVFQIMYRGIIQLCIRSGQYKTIHCSEIYRDELKSHNPITGEVTFHDPSTYKLRYSEDRKDGDVVGHYIYFKLVTGFEKSDYMTHGEVMAHARRYSKAYQYDLKEKKAASPWSTDPIPMGNKTVLLRCLRRYGVMSLEMQEMISQDRETFDEAQASADAHIDNELGAEPIDAAFEPNGDAAEGERKDDKPTGKGRGKDKNKGKDAKTKDVPKFKYQCDSKTCGIGFDEPEAGGGGVLLCPKCLSSEVHATGQ